MTFHEYRKRFISYLQIAVFFLLTSNYSHNAYSSNLKIKNGLHIKTTIQSFKYLRDKNIIKQSFDYSCGAAAMATLLTYTFNDKISEIGILKLLISSLSKGEINQRKKAGLSLYDLKKIAEKLGYQARGFRVTANVLYKLNGPVIVYIEPEGYEHFVVLKGIKYGRAYLADPSAGNTRLPMYQFLSIWEKPNTQGIIFVVEKSNYDYSQYNKLSISSAEYPQIQPLSTKHLLQTVPHNINIQTIRTP